MVKTMRVLIGIGVFAVLVGIHIAAQSAAQAPQARDRHSAAPASVLATSPQAVPRDAPTVEGQSPLVVNPGSTFVPPAGPHPAIGSWFGKAMEVCAQGVAPSACGTGLPAGILFMTVTITGDGLFVGDDSLTLLETPFGPHGTAHGSWAATSPTEFTADYVFLTKTYPPAVKGTFGTFSGARAKWQAQAYDENTLVGWVNAYFLDPTPIKWFPLAFNEYPAIPDESSGFVTPPTVFYKDPGQCLTDGCPRVFKFQLKRVAK